MSLHPFNLDAIPIWIDNSDLSPLDNNTYNLDKEIGNAIPSQGSSPLVENTLARPIPVDAMKVQYVGLESSIVANVSCSFLIPHTIEQATNMESQLVLTLERVQKRKESLQSIALNPSLSNSLEVSTTVGGTYKEENQDIVM
jgi:hypothetical protein